MTYRSEFGHSTLGWRPRWFLGVSFVYFVVLCPFNALGQGPWAAKEIAPGIIHSSYLLDGPRTVDVLEVDLSNPWFRIESYRLNGLVTTSEQARELAANGKRVIAAINADFFSFETGWPIGNQVVNGKFVLGTTSARSHFAVDDRGRPFIERLAFRGWVRTRPGKTYPISGVNHQHRRNSVVLHTSYASGKNTFAGSGSAFSLHLLSLRWIAGDTLKMLVRDQTVGDSTSILPNEAVLWIGDGDDVQAACDDIRGGDTLLVYLGFSPDLRRIEQVVGGGGRILEGGSLFSDSAIALERINPRFARDRHPRTFVAFDRDTTKLFLCTVDGRQANSIGMNFNEMGEFLKGIGCWNAINLDGGGSTTMVVEGNVVNSPSDQAGERPVANTLQVVERDSLIQKR